MSALTEVTPAIQGPGSAHGRARCMVVFDWNGTIVLDADRAREALNTAIAPHGLPAVSSAAFGSVFRLPMAEMFNRLGVPDPAIADAERTWNETMTARTTQLRGGTASVLTTLAADGAWLGVVSAASAAAVLHDRISLAVPEVWRAVLAPAEDKVTILRALRHHAEAAIYVGDTAYDMRSALESDYVPVGVRGGYASDAALLAAGATVLLDDLGALVDLVTEVVRAPAVPGPGQNAL